MSILDGIDAFHLVVAGFVLVVALIIPPTRAIVFFVAGLLWEGGKKVAGMIFAGLHEVVVKLWEAHRCWLMNWWPRSVVVPSLRRERTTRRVR